MSFEHVRKLGNAAGGCKSTRGHGVVIFEFPQVDGKAICVLLQPKEHLLSEKGALLWVQAFFKTRVFSLHGSDILNLPNSQQNNFISSSQAIFGGTLR